MATRCKGRKCAYGYGHHDEHVEAAKLGWKRRREGEAQYVGDAFGGAYELHRHKRHFILRSKADDTHFELDRSEYRELTAQMRREREAARREMIYQREVARLQRIIDKEHAPKQLSLREGREQLKIYQRAQRDAEKLERYRRREEYEEQKQSYIFERDQLYSAIRQSTNGKIRPYAANPITKKVPELEEYQAIPQMFRAKKRERSSEKSYTPDDIAAHLSELAPWLGIHSDSDLYAAFDKLARKRQNLQKQRHP